MPSIRISAVFIESKNRVLIHCLSLKMLQAAGEDVADVATCTNDADFTLGQIPCTSPVFNPLQYSRLLSEPTPGGAMPFLRAQRLKNPRISFLDGHFQARVNTPSEPPTKVFSSEGQDRIFQARLKLSGEKTKGQQLKGK